MITYNVYEKYLIKLSRCLRICSIPEKDKQPLYTLLGNRYKYKLPKGLSENIKYYYQFQDITDFQLTHIIVLIYNRLKKGTLNGYINKQITVKPIVDNIDMKFKYYKGDN